MDFEKLHTPEEIIEYSQQLKNKKRVVDLTVKPPVPTEIGWHELTEWRNIEELKLYHPLLYKKWKEQDKIPPAAIARAENK